MQTEFITPDPDCADALLWRAQAEATALIGQEAMAALATAGLMVCIDDSHLVSVFGPVFHVTDPDTLRVHHAPWPPIGDAEITYLTAPHIASAPGSDGADDLDH